ncbi:hypothetical protein FIM10_12125 [Sphingomonadales bacterium 56]|uniref:hypothetical protein n=1 Tax=Sphingobium sp. S6 TaxID=2758386 RepID=UPI00191893BF|nr:hypothetical protein [Sphingobium sp. S6]MBY2929420.1 hypothetical protein [Sphingomonadales bacterium 56]CAD7339430.1 hypothetical protein SPHS6_02451 [Sphingobium sp. S6]
MTNDEAELGAEVARELLADRELLAAPQVAAARFVKALLAANPRVKLPAIVANQRAKNWMEAARVTQSILREALAAGRKELKSASAETALKRPKKRQKYAPVDAEPVSTRNPRQQTASGTSAPADASSAHSVIAPKRAPHADLYSDVMVPN